MILRFFVLIVFVFCCSIGAAQNNITKTAGVNYTGGPPTFNPSQKTGSEYAIDTTNGRFYQLHRTSAVSGVWKLLGQGIDTIGTSVAPTYAPTRNMSWFVINALDSLYRYSGAGVLWDCLNCGNGTTNLTFTGASSPYTLNSSTGTDVTFSQGSGITLSRLLNNLSIAAIDVSATNEIQQIDTFTIVSNILRASLSSDGVPFKSVDLSAYVNVATDLTFTGAGPYTLNSSTGTDVTITQGAGITLTRTLNDLAVAAVDPSTTNEIQTYSHAGTTTYTNTLSLGGGAWSITGAGIAVISQTAGAVTVTANEVDGLITNELQAIANTSNATSHTATLSNAGGSLQLIEGTGITLTTGGSALDGTVLLIVIRSFAPLYKNAASLVTVLASDP